MRTCGASGVIYQISDAGPSIQLKLSYPQQIPVSPKVYKVGSPSMPATQLRLLTIPASHYCEKARWALEYSRVPFVESRSVQLLHYIPAWWYARTWFVPALLTPEGPVRDSSQILRYADARAPNDRRLLPDTEAERQRVETWERHFGETIGVETRRWLYFVAFEHFSTKQILDLSCQGTPAWQRPVTALLMPLARWILKLRLSVDRKRVEQGLTTLRAVFDEVGRELADGRRFLVGDRFSAADLCFASLSALILMPAEYGVRLPVPETLPGSAQSGPQHEVTSLRNTAAGQYALRIYSEWRNA
jgi:glutathione S-transferase